MGATMHPEATNLDSSQSLDIRVIMGQSDAPKCLYPVSAFRANQMQAFFWYLAHALGAYARVEAHLGAAGNADLLISRDLLATEPLVVVEFKERIATPAHVTKGLGQARRYRTWVQRETGRAPLTFLVAATVPKALQKVYVNGYGKRPVTVTDAAGLELALKEFLINEGITAPAAVTA